MIFFTKPLDRNIYYELYTISLSRIFSYVILSIFIDRDRLSTETTNRSIEYGKLSIRDVIKRKKDREKTRATTRRFRLRSRSTNFANTLLQNLQPETGFFYIVTDSWISRFWHAKSRFVAKSRIEYSNPKGRTTGRSNQTLKRFANKKYKRAKVWKSLILFTDIIDIILTCILFYSVIERCKIIR